MNITLASATGDVTEGGAGAAGYKDITVTLSRALTGSEQVLVVLNVTGADPTDDYSLALTGTNTAVQFPDSVSAGVYSLGFAAGATGATLRFTPVDNDERSQPAVRIAYGTGVFAPSGHQTHGPTVGTVSGSPLVFSIIDDETGDLVVPQDWPLKPAGLSGGDEFRLLFVTSQNRDATSSDIEVYNDFVQGVAASTGHASLKPYGGLVKVLACTSAANARVNSGMRAGNAWADGSTSDSSSGIPIYWLGSNNKVADNYHDFYDGSWDGTRANDDRTESGATVGNYDAFTGCGDQGIATFSTRVLPSPAGVFFARSSHHANPFAFWRTSKSRDDNAPFFAMSPVFTVSTEVPVVPGIEFDTAGFTVFENGAISYRYRLKTDPGANPVTVTVANTAGDVRTWSTPPRAQTFRTSSAPEAQRWNTWRTVTLHANDDTDADTSHETVSLVHTITQSSGAYSAMSPVALPGTILDDDATPADLITVTTVSTLLTEREVKRYSVNLKRAPGAGKVVTLTATLPKDDREALALQHPNLGPQHTVTRTFTNSNWNRPQWIRLYALNDNDKHSEQDLPVRHWTSIANADGTADTASVYHQAIVQPARVFITDDDAGRNEGFTVEIGELADNNPVIDKDEHADIEINFSDALGADEVLGLVVEISGAEHGADYAVGVHGPAGRGRIEPPAAVDAHGTVRTAITVVGNDEAAQMDQVRGVLLRIAAKTEEHRVITVKLIGAYSSDDTVAARDMVEGVRVRECASDDPDCASKVITILPTHRVVVQDGSTEVRSFPIEATLTEGASKTYNVKLSTSPGTGAGATVSFTSSDTGAATVSPATMTFTSGTFAMNQVLTVNAVSDTDAADESVSITMTVRGYPGVTVGPEIVLAVQDSSPAAIVKQGTRDLSKDNRGVQLTEGAGGETLTVTLRTDPGGTVTITPTSADPGAVTVSGAITLNSSNYSTGRTITVTPANDADSDDEAVQVTFAVSGYGTVTSAPPVMVLVRDTSPKVLVTPTALRLDEGTLGGYSISLNSDPGAGTTVTVTATPEGAGAPVSTTFDSDTWDSPRFVLVLSPQDDNQEDETFTIANSISASTSSHYPTTMTVPNVMVAYVDDDKDELVIAPATRQITLVEGDENHNTGSYTIALNTDPGMAVSVVVASGNPGAVHVDSGGTPGASVTLSFTHGSGGNWSAPQTVNVTARDDANGSDEAVMLTHTVTGYAEDPMGFTVLTRDDDEEPEAGLTLTPTTLDVFANEGVATYTVQLNTAPAGSVTVAVASSDTTHATVSPDTLTFAPSGANAWNVAQTVTVTSASGAAVNDTATITHTIQNSGDTTNYPTGTVSGATVAVTVVTDTRPVVSIDSTADPRVAEGEIASGSNPPAQKWATFHVESTANGPLVVNIEVTQTGNIGATSGGSAVGRRSASIIAGSTVGVMFVGVVDDSVDEPNGVVTATVLPGGNVYRAHADASEHTATVTLLDDDPTTVTLARAGGAAVAEGASHAYTLTLGRGLVKGETLTVPLTFNSGTSAATRNTDFTLACPNTLPTGVTCNNLNTHANPAVTFTGPNTGQTATSVTLTLTASTDAIPREAETVDIGMGTIVTTSGVLDSDNNDVGLGGGVTATDSAEALTITDVLSALTVKMTAPAGDVTEGASGASGRKDVTVALGYELTGSETVTVPLRVRGATVTDDYTFA
ncbi:MAG: hypothetical protein OXG27_15705, partial [Chloroflexi bacterium]|nr:hypothetical protein [Chloroflexota bacterium]